MEEGPENKPVEVWSSHGGVRGISRESGISAIGSQPPPSLTPSSFCLGDGMSGAVPSLTVPELALSWRGECWDVLKGHTWEGNRSQRHTDHILLCGEAADDV